MELQRTKGPDYDASQTSFNELNDGYCYSVTVKAALLMELSHMTAEVVGTSEGKRLDIATPIGSLCAPKRTREPLRRMKPPYVPVEPRLSAEIVFAKRAPIIRHYSCLMAVRFAWSWAWPRVDYQRSNWMSRFNTPEITEPG
jgi:hypothetical protein